eukprot:gene8079-4341_t
MVGAWALGRFLDSDRCLRFRAVSSLALVSLLVAISWGLGWWVVADKGIDIHSQDTGRFDIDFKDKKSDEW